MPRIQVVITFDDKILYLGYDREKAKEIWSSYGESDWLETDEDTVIELDKGE